MSEKMLNLFKEVTHPKSKLHVMLQKQLPGPKIQSIVPDEIIESTSLETFR